MMRSSAAPWKAKFFFIFLGLVVLQFLRPQPEVYSFELSADYYLPAVSAKRLGIQSLESLLTSTRQYVELQIHRVGKLLPPYDEDPTIVRKYRVVAVESVRSTGTDVRWPVYGAVSSGFGMRRHPITRRRSFHSGIDIKSRWGTPCAAPFDGTVISACRSGAMGKMVKIRCGSDFILAFGHLASICCVKGERIKKGQIIGLIGATGRATGPHLHFEIRKEGRYVNPLVYLGKKPF